LANLEILCIGSNRRQASEHTSKVTPKLDRNSLFSVEALILSAPVGSRNTFLASSSNSSGLTLSNRWLLRTILLLSDLLSVVVGSFMLLSVN
jgi:hypothetical protein